MATVKTGRQPISRPIVRLIAVAVVWHGRFLELGLLATDDETRPPNEVRAEFFDKITDQSRKLDPQIIAMIEGSPRAAELLPEARLNRQRFDAVERELTRWAVAQNPALGVMLAANRLPQRSQDNPPGLKIDAQHMIERVLKIDRLASPKPPPIGREHVAHLGVLRKDVRWEDRKPNATEAAAEKFHEIWQRGWELAVADDGRLEPPAIFAPVLDSRRHDRAILYGIAEAVLLSAFIPIACENPRALRDAARQGWRGELRKLDAKQRGGTGGREAKAAGTEENEIEFVGYEDAKEDWRNPDHNRRVFVRDLETDTEREYRTIEDEIAGQEQQRARKALAARALRVAKKRWGDDGVRFLEGYRETGSVQKASEYAGVDRRTGYRYLEKLKAALEAPEEI